MSHATPFSSSSLDVDVDIEPELETETDTPGLPCSVWCDRLEEMEATVKVMDNASKINDWVAINNGKSDSLSRTPHRRRKTNLADVVLVLTPAFPFGASPIEFDKLTRFVARHQTLTSTLPPAAQTPALYIKSIIDMDVQITETTKREKDSKKKMNAANAKGLNGMKQKVKKQLREFENAVNAYRAVSRIAGVGSGRGPVQN